jgi:hypothetical protein
MKTVPANPKPCDYTALDWLELHNISHDLSIEAVARIRRVCLPSVPAPRTGNFNLTADAAWLLAAKAIVHFAPELAQDVNWVHQFCEKNLSALASEEPYTKERGADCPPFVSLSYQGTPEDALCVAHEFGHALQYHLAKGRFIPPALRELAAFISEKTFLDFIRKNRNELYNMLNSAWQQDNRIYFGDDTDNLLDALKSPTDPYTYRMNYPLARLLSEVTFETLPRSEFYRVFHGSLTLAECLLNANQNGVETNE